MVAESRFLKVYIRQWLLNHIFWTYTYVRGIERINYLDKDIGVFRSQQAGTNILLGLVIA